MAFQYAYMARTLTSPDDIFNLFTYMKSTSTVLLSQPL